MRRSVKITSKCLNELEEALTSPISKQLKDRTLQPATEYVSALKTFKRV